jgi:hypothetical protein
MEKLTATDIALVIDHSLRNPAFLWTKYGQDECWR